MFLHGGVFICCQVKQFKNSNFFPLIASININAMIKTLPADSQTQVSLDKKREVKGGENITTHVAFQAVHSFLSFL